jgi:hypothetical protein
LSLGAQHTHACARINVELIETKLTELEKEVDELRRIIVLSRLKCNSIKSEKEKLYENK